MRTLILNAGYEPMILVNWKRAICLVLSEKAEILAEYDECVHTVSKSYPLPSVVRLTRYVLFVKRFGVVRCTRKNIILRDNCHCQYCGIRCNTKTVSIDHVIPKARGGKTVWDNVVAACHTCNRKKGHKNLDNIDMQLLRKPKRPSWQDIAQANNSEFHDSWLSYLSRSA